MGIDAEEANPAPHDAEPWKRLRAYDFALHANPARGKREFELEGGSLGQSAAGVEKGTGPAQVIDVPHEGGLGLGWPEEGGPQSYPDYSREVLTRHDPEIFDRIDAKWGEIIRRSG